MIVFILRRLLHTIPVLLGVTMIVFLSIQLIPGDVAQTLLGFSATAERVAALRRDLGLDKPIYIQYATWLWKLIQGDLGRSIAMRVPVASVLGIKIVNSLILSGASLLIVIVGSFFLGTISAAHFRKPFDRFTVFFTLFIAALPVFWLGIVLLYVFGVKLRLFPLSGMYNMANPGGLPDLLHHVILPAVTIAASSMAIVTRVTRSGLIDALTQPYILAAHSRGLTSKRVTYLHGVRNVLPTFANMCGLQVGYLFGCVVFAEIIFSWPGVGLQLYDSILLRDAPMVQGCVLVVAAVFVLGNLVADVIVYALDPTRR
jgi:peptide/nickel transport system permease protein